MGTLQVSYGTETNFDTQYASFTVWTTRVSNPVCYPHFRASASISPQQAASPLVFFLISTHSTATPEIPLASELFKKYSPICRTGVGPQDYTDCLHFRLRSFTPSDSEQRLHLVLPRLLARSLPVLPLKVFIKTEVFRYSFPTVVYTLKCFFHTWRCCVRVPHCAIFPTALL